MTSKVCPSRKLGYAIDYYCAPSNFLTFRRSCVMSNFWVWKRDFVGFTTLLYELAKCKTFWKIETAHAIFWMYLGGTAKKIFFFRNKTFLFFKIESWNFQVQFEIKFRETSQNLNKFSLFRQLLFSFFYRMSDWVKILWGFTKFFFKQMLKISAFYLVKQKSFITN